MFVVTVKTRPSWQTIERYWPKVRIFLGRCAWVKWKCEYPILRRCEWLRRFFPRGIPRNLKKNYYNGLVWENKQRLTFGSDQKVLKAWHLVLRWNNLLCKLNSWWSKMENRCYFLLFPTALLIDCFPTAKKNSERLHSRFLPSSLMSFTTE